MRFTITLALASTLSLVGCGDPQAAEDELNDSEYAVDENGLLIYSSTGEFEEEPPAGGWELQLADKYGEELDLDSVKDLPTDEEVFAAEPGFLDPSLGSELSADEVDGDLAETGQDLVSCTKRRATGYKSGRAFSITLVKTDSKPAGINAANAFYYMERAAARAGISLIVNSGFRSMSEQRYLYNCYLTKRCNGGNLAARPGYSNHQSGVALDISTRSSRTYNWLKRNARRWGYVRTVPSEPWHWEYRGATRNAPCRR